MIRIYGIPVYEEKAGMSDNIEVNLDKSNILSAFKAVISKQEVRNEFENILCAEVQKNQDLLTEAGECVSKAWINSCLECMPCEIAQRISKDQDVIGLVTNDLTTPIVEKIKKASSPRKRKVLFLRKRKADCTMLERAIIGAATFNTAILDEAMNIELRTDPREALAKLWKE